MKNTQTVVPGLHVGAGSAWGPLDVFPIWTDAPMPRSRRYRMPDGDEAGLVRESEDGPSVAELVIDNRGGRRLLVLEGMTLDGGMQHRVLTQSVLAAADALTPIPVRCVEVSRWHGALQQRFGTTDAPVRIRAALRAAHPDQTDVWARVADYESRHGHQPTHSLTDLLGETSRALSREAPRLRPLPAQRGVIIAALGHPLLLEVVDHPATLAARWDALLGGLSADVLGLPHIATPAWRARSFARRVSQSHVDQTPGAGVGTTLAADDRHLVSMRGIRDDVALLHASAINTRHELTLAA